MAGGETLHDGKPCNPWAILVASMPPIGSSRSRWRCHKAIHGSAGRLSLPRRRLAGTLALPELEDEFDFIINHDIKYRIGDDRENIKEIMPSHLVVSS